MTKLSIPLSLWLLPLFAICISLLSASSAQLPHQHALSIESERVHWQQQETNAYQAQALLTLRRLDALYKEEHELWTHYEKLRSAAKLREQELLLAEEFHRQREALRAERNDIHKPENLSITPLNQRDSPW